MKAENYNNIISQLSNPDTMSEGLVALSEQLKADEADYNNLVNSNNSLRDTNSKLALKITNHVEVQEKPEPTPDEVFDELFTKHFTN